MASIMKRVEAFWKGDTSTYPFKLYVPGGDWLSIKSYDNGTTSIGFMYPWGPIKTTTSNYLDPIATVEYALLDTIVYTNGYLDGNVYGSLDGVYFVPGTGLSSEDTLTINGDTYLAVQNGGESDLMDFAAIKLE